MLISPAILATDEEEFRRKVEAVRPLGLPLHLDVMDGQFVPQATWADPGKVKNILGDLPFVAHLMVADPEHAVMVWLAAGAELIYFHAETTNDEELILRAMRGGSDHIGIAINPDTPMSRLTHAIDGLKHVLIMGVTPGRSGQQLQAIAAEKIAALKELRPNLQIAVDGGVRPENANALARAGADILVSGSYLTDAPDPVAALAQLKYAIRNNP